MVAVRTLSDNVVARFVNPPTFNVYTPTSPPATPNCWFYDAIVQGTPTEMYVVGYPDAGDAYTSRHGAAGDALNWGFTFVCAGRDRGQVTTLIGLVRARMAGFTPDPNGDTWIEQALGNRILPDLSVPADVRFSFTLRYTLTTRS